MAKPKPIYKIEIYDPSGPTLRHSITADALPISITPRVTSGVGTFEFWLHRGFGTDWTKFNDIVCYDDVYIWLDFESLSTNPRMRGKIGAINEFLTDDGALMQISGLNYGEVLLRLLKTKYWETTQADTIVKEINDDAGLDGSYNHIAADATNLNYDAVDKSLFDILQDISEIRDKDWYVAYCYTHNAKELFWFARQSNTSTVTLEEKVNLRNYSLLQDWKPIRNDITVYGARLKTLPSDKDGWTESVSQWYSDGTISTNVDRPDVSFGNVSINFNRASAQTVYGSQDFLGITTVPCKFPHEYKNLHFNFKLVQGPGNPGSLSLRLRKDASNYFRNILYPQFHRLTIGGDWVAFVIPLGREAEGAGANNQWRKVGTLEWDEITDFWFQQGFTGAAAVCEVRIDLLYFGEARVVGTASDATSQTNYGLKSMVVIDDTLSSSAAQDYATYLNAQLKDPVKQLTCTVRPAELDLQVGDRVTVEIPSKSIDTYYDLIQVTHTLSQTGLISTCVLNSRKEMRDLASFQDLNARLAKIQRNLEIGLWGKIIK